MEELFTEDDRQYISLLQQNVDRMASNRANAKLWLATLATAIAALQFSIEGEIVIWLAVLLVLVFYVMDCLYLSLERKYLHLMQKYVTLCKEGDEEGRKQMLYNFDISKVKDDRTTFWQSMISRNTLPFYLILFLAALAISIWSLIAIH